MHCAATNISNAVDTSEESEVSGSDKEDSSWISWLRANKFICEVDEYFILDDFNLCGLSHQVPYYDYTLDLILDAESSYDGEVITEEQNELIESAAEMLYGMIHARYILTGSGLESMLRKKYEFRTCPSVYCRRQPLLPLGLSDIPRASNVKIYCQICEDVYHPPSKYQASHKRYHKAMFQECLGSSYTSRQGKSKRKKNITKLSDLSEQEDIM